MICLALDNKFTSIRIEKNYFPLNYWKQNYSALL